MRRASRYAMVVFPLFPQAAIAATEPSQVAPGSSLMEWLLPMLAVVFALAALWWTMRRHGGRGLAAGPTRIVQVLAVGPRERILVVDHDTQRFMLGVTPTTINLLARLDSKDAAKNPESATPLQHEVDISARE